MTAPDQHALREALARDYVLVKRGLYYRSDNMGYTGVLDDAGRYTAEDVKRHQDHGDEVRGILASEAPRFSHACWPETVTATLTNDLRVAEVRARAAEAEITRLKEGMEAAATRFEDIAAGRAFQPRLHAAAGATEARSVLTTIPPKENPDA